MHLIKPSWLRHSGMSVPLRFVFSFPLGSLLRPEWKFYREAELTDLGDCVSQCAGEQKDFEVYSCHVSPDGERLATAGGGPLFRFCARLFISSYPFRLPFCPFCLSSPVSEFVSVYLLQQDERGIGELTGVKIDGHVRVWSTESIYKANDDSYTKPRQLCHMSHHLGTIHSVRFSPNGRYLASGADDKIICIYQLDSSPPPVAASFGTQ